MILEYNKLHVTAARPEQLAATSLYRRFAKGHYDHDSPAFAPAEYAEWEKLYVADADSGVLLRCRSDGGEAVGRTAHGMKAGARAKRDGWRSEGAHRANGALAAILS